MSQKILNDREISAYKNKAQKKQSNYRHKKEKQLLMLKYHHIKKHVLNYIIEKGSSFDIEASAYDEEVSTQKEC